MPSDGIIVAVLVYSFANTTRAWSSTHGVWWNEGFFLNWSLMITETRPQPRPMNWSTPNTEALQTKVLTLCIRGLEFSEVESAFVSCICRLFTNVFLPALLWNRVPFWSFKGLWIKSPVMWMIRIYTHQTRDKLDWRPSRLPNAISYSFSIFFILIHVFPLTVKSPIVSI